MEQTRRHIRLDFAPLDVATSVYVLSSGSPAMQVYNSSTGEYEPDRGLTPCVIIPQVMLNAQDGSVTDALGNANLAQMVWYVDEEDISTLSDWQGLYEIETDGDYKGTITIYKNLAPLEQHTLHFEAVVADTRTGNNYPIVTDGIILSTVSMTLSEMYNLAMECDTSITYDPLYDKLFVYEYAVANGYVDDTTAGREQATTNSAYLKEIPLILYDGKGVYEGDYTVKVYEVLGWQGSVLELEEITITDDDDNEFNEITPTKLVMDLRMVDKKDYIVKAFIDDEEVASIQYGVERVETPYKVMSVNGASRKISDTVRQDMVKVIHGRQAMDYPECVIRIVWITNSAYLTGVEHGEGVSIEYTIASTGAGTTADDGWIDEYVDTTPKEYHKVATADDGTIYSDEEGNTFIFN